ncbi:MAG TPA: peptidase S49 [Brevundimonas diminuta]|nr:peptidase S49 [Brevundimonas diminuta]
MSMLLPHIAARLFDTPLLLAPEKASAMLMGLGGRMVEGGIVIVDGPAGDGGLGGRVGVLGPWARRMHSQDRAVYPVVDGVAIIGVEGSLVQKGAYLGQSSGETSYQGIQVQVARAKAEAGQLKGAVFEVDSLGGEVSGAFETFDAIADLSKALPTMAILTDAACSGGYLLASGCRQIVMPESGMSGSIGVLTMHLDQSEKMAKEGSKVEFIVSGAYKADGSSAAPMSDDLRSRLKARNDQVRERFAISVASGRRGRMTKAQVLATEARIYFGQEALDIGLVDAIAPAQEAFASFAKAVNA